MRAGQPDWLFTSALISVKFEPVALIAASTNISLPTTGLRHREVRQRRAAVFLRQARERAGEAGVVVGGDLVVHEVAAVVLVGSAVVRRRGPADQRAVEHVAALDREGELSVHEPCAVRWCGLRGGLAPKPTT